LLEIARRGLTTAVTDFGAMGLGSAALETAEATGGLFMDLALHPVKYRGIQPWQIIASETQDRMLIVARPEDREKVFERAGLHGVQATELGELTDSGFVHLKYKYESAALIDIEKLFDKSDRKHMNARWEEKKVVVQAPSEKNKYSLEESLCMVMEQPDVASKEWFFRQKDSSVKGATIMGPLLERDQQVEADATMQKPLDTEGRNDWGAIAYALGISPKGSDIDPYHSAQRSFIDMVGKIIAIGGTLPDMENPKWDSWAVCGNYCQPNSEGKSTLYPETGKFNLASLIREGIGVREAVEATNIPIISGKDSMKCSCVYEVDDTFDLENVPADLRKHIILAEDKKTGKRSIEIHDPDTFLASAAVKIRDYRKCVSPEFKIHEDIIFVVGTTKAELGASQYNSAIGYKEQASPLEGGACPKADLEEFVNVANAVHTAIDQELVASCKYVSEGGIGVALAKSAMAGKIGAYVRADCVPRDESCRTTEEILYSETPGRFIVTVDKCRADEFRKAMKYVACYQIGIVISKNDFVEADEDHVDSIREAMRNAACNKMGIVTLDNGLIIERTDGTIEQINMQKVKERYQKPLRFDLDVALKKGAE
jgi:phosphoribosylformylglycinamidine synthase subunit PurSL